MTSVIPSSAGHSSLDLFDKIPILEPIQWSNSQQTFPTNSLNEASIDFQLETDRNVFLDLQETYILLKVRLKKGKDDVKVTDKITLVNNALHSLFSNCEVFFNNEQVYTSNGLYAHKAFISNEFSGTKGTKESISICHGYQYESEPNNFTSSPFTTRIDQSGEEIVLYGRLAIDVFTCDKLLLPNINVRIRLIRSRPAFYLFTESTSSTTIIADIKEASLYTRQVAVDDRVFRSITTNLQKEPARYNFTEVLPKTFIIPSGQNQYIQENIFNNAPIRRLALAMNSNSAFSGTKKSNPFHYQKFGLREIKIVRGNQVVSQLDCVNNARPYVTTMQALKFEEDGPNIPLSDYENHFVLVFDLTSTQESNVLLYYPDVVGGSLRLEMYFERNLTETIEVIVLGERLSTIFIDKGGSVVKNG